MLNFVMGLTLTFTDNASSGLQSAVNSLDSFVSKANSASKSLNDLASLYALSNVADNLGSSFLKAGTTIYQGFSGAISKVQDVGTEFQSLRIILNALDKDEKKAEDSLNKLIDFAATTPFELEDLTGLFTTIKANGIDAFEVLTGATSGIQENVMSAIGDLMMFRSDVPAQQWALAIRNAFSGQKKSLQSALDINVEDMLGRKWGDTPEQIAQDFLDLADAIGVAGMMGGSFENNMKTQLANISDLFTKTWLKISDKGVFDDLLVAVQSLTSNLTKAFSDTNLDKFAESIYTALHPILKVIGDITTKLSALIPKIVDFLGNHPALVRFIAVVGALGGVILTLSGLALKSIASFSNLAIVFKTMGYSFGDVLGVMRTGIVKLRGWILPVITLLGLLAVAWKTDFAGIQTRTKEFVNNVTTAFKTARQGVSGDIDTLKSVLKGLDRNDFFDGLTISIMRVQTLFQALKEGWNNYTLSEDTFQKAKELGILPLIEAIFDLKYRFDNFKEGFKQGWQEIGEFVGSVIDNLKVSLKGTIFEDLLDNITSFIQKLGDNDPESWKTIGEIFGKISAVILICVTAFKIWKTVISPIFNLITKIFGVVKSVISFLVNNPVVMIITGIVTAVSSFFSMLKNGFSWIKEALMVVGIALVAIGAIILGAPALITAVIAGIVAVVATLVVLIKEHWNEIVEWCKTAIEKIKEFFSKIGDWVNTHVIQPVVNFFKGLWEKLVEIWNTIVNVIKTAVMLVGSIISATVQIILLPWRFLWENFGHYLIEAWDFIKEKVRSAINTVKDIISTVVSAIVGFIQPKLQAIKDFFTSIFNAIRDLIRNIFDGIRSKIQTIIETIVGFIQPKLEAIKNKFSEIFNGIKTVVSSIFNNIKEKITSIIDAVKGVISTKLNAIKSTFTNILNGIKSAVSTVFNGIKTTISNIIDGAKSIVDKGLGAIKGFFDKLKLKFPDIKLPHFSIEGKLSIDPPSVPKLKIDWYEKGGVFNKPSIIGVGEAGTEAVMPLQKNTEWIGILAGKLLSGMNQSSIMPSNKYTGNSSSGGSSQGYLQSNNTTNTTTNNSNDNSITFQKGAITIVAQNSSIEEAQRMAEYIMQYIQRKNELKDMANYKS